MRKIIVLTGIMLFLIAYLCFAQQEEFTITTYYPSPHGVYGELVTNRFGVGDKNGDGNLTDADVPPDGNDGEVWINGPIIAEGAVGSGPTLTTSGAGAKLIWYPRKAAFRAGEVGASQWDDANIGYDSFAAGLNTIASAPYSTALGLLTSATDSASFASGYETAATGAYSTAMGFFTTASDHSATALGSHTTASGMASTATGSYTVASGEVSTAIGFHTTASGTHSIAMGYGFQVGAVSTPLVNNIPNSLMIGFNSNIPTFFVGPSSGVGTIGNVGIGTTDPKTMLHIYEGPGGIAPNPLNYDYLTIESDDHICINMISAVNKRQNILFSDDQRARGIVAYEHATDEMYFYTAGAQRVTIDSNGNVGIGDTTPLAIDGKFEVNPNGTEDDGDEVVVSGSGSVGIGTIPLDPKIKLDIFQGGNLAGSYGIRVNAVNGGFFTSSLNPSAQATLASGNYGIKARGNCAGDFRGTVYGAIFVDSDDNTGIYLAYGNWGLYTDHDVHLGSNVIIGTAGQPNRFPNYQLELSADSAAKPTSNTWTVVSDRRVKKNIEPFTDGLDIITKINPVRYRLNGKAGTPRDQEGISVIGQEIKDIAPYTTKTYRAKLESNDKEEIELLNFDSSPLIFVMVNAIKEQQEQIVSLKLEIEELKGQFSAGL